MLRQYRLLLPGVASSRGICGRLVANAISAQHGLAAVTPGRNSSGVDDLALHVKSTDEEGIAFVLEVLKDRASVLPHEDCVGRVVVDSELVCDAVSLADAVQSYPRSGGVSQVVVPGIARRPPRHGALLDAINQPARFRLAQQRHKFTLEHREIGVHSQIRIASHKAANGWAIEQYGGIEHAQHEIMLTRSYLWVCREHVVKISQIRQTYSGGLQGRSDSGGAGAVERRAQVQRVRYRVEQGLGWDIALAWMNRCRELNVWTPDRACKVQPFLDCQIGIRVTTAAWGQFLECRGEHTELHVLGL